MTARAAWTRLVRADDQRRSRLHDESGQRMPLSELRHLPRNVGFVARRLMVGTPPALPWLTFNALDRLERLIKPDWEIVEFGSGMSTAWYAARARSVHSIEGNPEWYARLAFRTPSNVRYELRDIDNFTDLSDHTDASLDLAVIDCPAGRDACVEAALPKMKSHGWVLLDNSDKDRPDIRAAEMIIRRAAGSVEAQTGLTVGMLSAHAWLLAQLR